MHELSIALSILEMAAEVAERQGAKRVAAIHLRLGPLSGLDPDALRSAYELARPATSCDQAELLIEEVPLATYCPTCRAERALESIQLLCCPICGAATPDVVRGRELEVTALEIDS
jgi:hydrogenase nickel incorporation protein HypA/HybF